MEETDYDYFSELSVLKEARAVADVKCPSLPCVLSLSPDDNETVPIAVRLVDLCAHLMANAMTCHHRSVPLQL